MNTPMKALSFIRCQRNLEQTIVWQVSPSPHALSTDLAVVANVWFHCLFRHAARGYIFMFLVWTCTRIKSRQLILAFFKCTCTCPLTLTPTLEAIDFFPEQYPDEANFNYTNVPCFVELLPGALFPNQKRKERFAGAVRCENAFPCVVTRGGAGGGGLVMSAAGMGMSADEAFLRSLAWNVVIVYLWSCSREIVDVRARRDLLAYMRLAMLFFDSASNADFCF